MHGIAETARTITDATHPMRQMNLRSTLAACERTDARIVADASRHQRGLSPDRVRRMAAGVRRAQTDRYAEGRNGAAFEGKQFQRLHWHGGRKLSFHSDVPEILPRAGQCAAAAPCWNSRRCRYGSDDFAPHDVGRYPYATGQAYAARSRANTLPDEIFPPYYLYPAGAGDYQDRLQMPVEESANMLIMLETAREPTAQTRRWRISIAT